MSLILTWDNPTDVMAPAALSARVSRGSPIGPQPVVVQDDRFTDVYGINPLPITPTFVVGTDVTWGIFEDKENNDPTLAYTVEYLDRYGQPVQTITDIAIKRYMRPQNTVRVDIHDILPDGSPNSNGVYEVTAGTSFVRRVLLNRYGRGMLILRWGEPVAIRNEGNMYAYELVAPRVQSITFEDLIATSTQIASDRRGWY